MPVDNNPRPDGRQPPPRQPDFNPAGWTLLGEQTVDGRVDKDQIEISQKQGSFSRLTFVVLDSDLEMRNATILFVSGKSYEPNVGQVFREGSRSRVIELPPSATSNGTEILRRVSFTYGNLQGGGRARVQVWGGGDAGNARPNPTPAPTPPPPPPRAFQFDASGWTMIGERSVDGKVDTDQIEISQKLGKFTKIVFVVLDSDLEMISTDVLFVSGKKFSPEFKQVFREDTRTRVIDLPVVAGKPEILRRISFKYKNLAGGGKARVQVWGRN